MGRSLLDILLAMYSHALRRVSYIRTMQLVKYPQRLTTASEIPTMYSSSTNVQVCKYDNCSAQVVYPGTRTPHRCFKLQQEMTCKRVQVAARRVLLYMRKQFLGPLRRACACCCVVFANPWDEK